jgi:hypothetical protein
MNWVRRWMRSMSSEPYIIFRALVNQLNELGKKVDEANLTLGDFEKAKRKESLRETVHNLSKD